MAAFLIYILKAAVVLAVLHSLYRLCLKRETLHSLNRAVLLFILVASAVLPLCRFTVGHDTAVARATADVEAFIVEQAAPAPVSATAAAPVAAAPALWPRLLALVYVGGVCLCVLGYVRSLLSLWLLIGLGRRVRVDGTPRLVRVVECRGLGVACSWMRWVMLPPGLQGAQCRAVLAHELAHVRLGHSWDMLLCDLTVRLLWFLPSAWMLRKDLTDIHEYQADSRVLALGVDADAYQQLLIATAVKGRMPSAANSFSRSTVKKRLYMMCRKPSARAAALKAAYLIPLVAVVGAAFARPTIIADISNKLADEQAAAPLLSPKALREAVLAEPSPVVADDVPVDGGSGEEDAAGPEPAVTEAGDSVAGREVPPEDSALVAVAGQFGPATAEAKAGNVSPDDGQRPSVPPVTEVETAPLTMMEYRRLRHKFWVESADGETRLVLLVPINRDPQRIVIDASQSYIYDTVTGDRYMCRRIEGYGGKSIDISVAGNGGSLTCFTLVFPRLERSVKRVVFHCPGFDHEAVYALDDISRDPVRVIR